MKKPVLLICLAGLLLAGLPLMAQNGGHIIFYPPVRVAPGTQNPAVPTGILPQQFQQAYGFNRIPNQGQGMTIALVDAFDDPNIESDLAYYANYFHFAPCNFQKVKMGNPPPDSGWALEISLDVEQACLIAPKANIILVEAASNYDSDLFPAVQAAYTAPYNAQTISMSWGGGEDSTETGFDSYFQNIVNGNGQPVTFFASSGDGSHGTGYPAASPYVIAVGGTNLYLRQATPLGNFMALNYGHENAWYYSSGGVSTVEPQPSWQNPACATWSTTNRCIPDVASVASNIPVYDTYGYGGWVAVQGTSISSPDWAAFMTLVNSGRVLHGKPTMSQAAYDIYQVYYSGNYLTNFNDITSGNNGGCGSQCQAGTGYDLITGTGTYQAQNLYQALLATAH
jgi:subtilase family serine protease